MRSWASAAWHWHGRRNQRLRPRPSATAGRKGDNTGLDTACFSCIPHRRVLSALVDAVVAVCPASDGAGRSDCVTSCVCVVAIEATRACQARPSRLMGSRPIHCSGGRESCVRLGPLRAGHHGSYTGEPVAGTHPAAGAVRCAARAVTNQRVVRYPIGVHVQPSTSTLVAALVVTGSRKVIETGFGLAALAGRWHQLPRVRWRLLPTRVAVCLAVPTPTPSASAITRAW